jgi:hypothetical protein
MNDERLKYCIVSQDAVDVMDNGRLNDIMVPGQGLTDFWWAHGRGKKEKISKSQGRCLCYAGGHGRFYQRLAAGPGSPAGFTVALAELVRAGCP